MRKSPHTIDGFVPRKGRRELGNVQRTSLPHDGESTQHQIGQSPHVISSQPEMSLPRPQTVSRKEIDESLSGIDEEPAQPKRRGLLRRRGPKQPPSRRKKLIKRGVLLLVLVGLVLAGYVGVKALTASSSIFKGSILDIFQSKPLKMDANGRTNILILGSTDDDPSHPGNNLTDTIIVASIDQNKNNAYLFSIPRDLWVKYGRACDAGYQGKINVYFSCSNDGTDAAAEQARLTSMQQFVGDITGLNIQYGVHVNSVVVREAVDAVGGVDVDVQGSGGAPGVLDRNFDGQCRYKCYWVKYDNGVHHLDGGHAMYLSMARGESSPTYGLGRSNFDREVNQQKVLISLKDKATSANTLSNPGKVTALLDSLGNNLRTNFQTSEIQTLMKVGKSIPSSSVTRVSLLDDQNPVVTTGSIDGQSIVQPTSGLFDYTDIQTYIQKSINATAITKENAHVALLNGSGITGYAQTRSDDLTKRGFTISTVDNAPAGQYAEVQLYDVTHTKSATKAKLEQIYGVKARTDAPPLSLSADTDFVVIFGPTNTAN